MTKKISQETFDDVVNENIEDFGMSPEDALKDTISQFQKQGVTLSNIDISGGIGRQEMLDALSLLDSVARSSSSVKESILEAIGGVAALCTSEHPQFERNVMLMREKGGLNSLHILFDTKFDTSVVVATMNLLNSLSQANVETRDFFEPGGCQRLCDVLRFDAGSELSGKQRAISLARTVIKSETNKNMMMREGAGEILVKLVNDHVLAADGMATEGGVPLLLQEACQLVRGLCIHDDYRKDMSCAYDNGRFFIKQTNFVQSLSTLAKGFRTQPGVASAALLAARNLINTEEAVQVISQYGAIELITDILRWENSSLSLAKSAVALMRNVCADDVRKDKLVCDGTLDLLIASMTKDTHAADHAFMEHALACLACMSLRSPSNSLRIVQTGSSLDIIVKTMRRYGDRAALQRQACLVLRNIAARCPELRGQLLDAGVESVLRDAGRLQGVVDEAYGALRDLECEVHFVKIGADGTVAPAYEQFGAAPKLQFNPVYDEDVRIEERVREEARAPLQADRLRNLGDEDDEAAAAEEHSGGCCGGDAAGHTHDHAHDHSV